MISICSHFLEWRRCRDWWRDWSRQSDDWSCCLWCHTGLLGTVGKLTVSTEVGPQTIVIAHLSVGHFILSPSLSSQEIFLSTFFNFPTPSFTCDHDIHQMQAIPEKQKGKKSFSAHSTKVTSTSACGERNPCARHHEPLVLVFMLLFHTQ